MIFAVFARANHPRNGWSHSHGYSVLVVRCGNADDVKRATQRLQGMDGGPGRPHGGTRLPDGYREDRWYSGKFEYLFSIQSCSLHNAGRGPELGGPYPWDGITQSSGVLSLGDNRALTFVDIDVLLHEDPPPYEWSEV